MEIVTDLHMHSTCSDGKSSPSIIFDKVVKAGLSTFALSYHDAIDHIPEMNSCIKSKKIEIQFIPVTEISCEHNGESIHILAHPGAYGKHSKNENIFSLVLDGMEVYHSHHRKKLNII